MTQQIQWETEWDRALSRAEQENKPILLFFHNPE
jgi:uncharacterized protein YyaL (SSP411 family)